MHLCPRISRATVRTTHQPMWTTGHLVLQLSWKVQVWSTTHGQWGQHDPTTCLLLLIILGRTALRKSQYYIAECSPQDRQHCKNNGTCYLMPYISYENKLCLCLPGFNGARCESNGETTTPSEASRSPSISTRYYYTLRTRSSGTPIIDTNINSKSTNILISSTASNNVVKESFSNLNNSLLENSSPNSPSSKAIKMEQNIATSIQVFACLLINLDYLLI